MDSNFNKFIDFGALFEALIVENEDVLNEVEKDVGDETYKDILNFKASPISFEIDIDECDMDDNRVVFVFFHSDNNANESNNQSSGVVCTIIYDIMTEDFTDFTSEEY